eukprot:SAG31_NODE_731_length_12498_cov_7.368336_7_plen_182_part_00
MLQPSDQLTYICDVNIDLHCDRHVRQTLGCNFFVRHLYRLGSRIGIHCIVLGFGCHENHPRSWDWWFECSDLHVVRFRTDDCQQLMVHATHPSSDVRCAEFMPRAQRAAFTAASSSWWAVSAALAAWAGSRLQSKTVEAEVQLELLPAAVALLLLAVMVPESPQFLSAVGRDKVRGQCLVR